VALLAFFGLILMLGLLSFPGGFAYRASQSEDFAAMRWPLLAVLEMALTAILVIIVGIWRLLTLVQQDRLFSAASTPWLRAITAAAGTIAAIFAIAVPLAAWASGDPGWPVVLMFFALLSGTLTLITIVTTQVIRDHERQA
jgi:hypothetical protein